MKILNHLYQNLMKGGHKSFMSERAPADGHKKNIISKTHNFVGIGYYLNGGQFRYYEEFIDRYLEFEKIPAQIRAGQNTKHHIQMFRKILSILHYCLQGRLSCSQEA